MDNEEADWEITIQECTPLQQAASQIGNSFHSTKEAIAYVQGYQHLNDRLTETKTKMQKRINDLSDKLDKLESE